MAKSILASKTFWVNLIALIGSAGAGFGLDIPIEDQGALVGGIMAAVNIGLRFTTKQPVSLRGDK